jgi:hypothetical protein
MTHAVQVDVRRSGRTFEAEAVIDVAADPSTVWSTITDYAALPSFMPGIRHCRVHQRHDLDEGHERLVVEQSGEFRFMLFSQSMKVMLDIENAPQRFSHAKATSFDLGILRRSAIDVFEGRYEIHHPPVRRGPRRVQLRYSALIGLRLPPPPAVGSVAVKQNLTAQLEAVAGEISRRSA